MRFQLVLQFEATGDRGSYDKLIAFEEVLAAAVEQKAYVEGHDAGSGEMNIFLFTDDPVATFLLVQETDEAMWPDGQMRAAYRPVDFDEFVCLWPPDLKNFRVL